MLVKEYKNARDYLNDHEENLLENEAVSQLVLYDAYKSMLADQNDQSLFGVVLEEETPLLHFCNVAPHNLAVYAQGSGKDILGPAAATLADYMNSNHIPFSGINARQEVCLSFIEQYKKGNNYSFVEKLGMDIMELRKVNDTKPMDGKYRPALPEEVMLVTDWMINFEIEALASEINYERTLNRAKYLIEKNKLYLYEDSEQRLVSMAAASRQLTHGVLINYVYTPAQFRGQGYAAANIYYMSKELLEQGNQFCTMFVDRKNPLSARAYEKVGFHILEDNYEYLLLQT